MPVEPIDKMRAEIRKALARLRINLDDARGSDHELYADEYQYLWDDLFEAFDKIAEIYE